MKRDEGCSQGCPAKKKEYAVRMFARVGLSLILAAAVAAPALGATVYTDESAFVAAITPGYYLEDFGAYTTWKSVPTPIHLGPVNGWTYDISSAPGNLWGLGTFSGCLSTEWPDATITVTPTGAQPVHAIGGLFFGTDWDGDLSACTISIVLSDGTTETFGSGTTDREFYGFRSPVPITSLSMNIPGNPHNANLQEPYPTLDHLYVGAPEPATLSLLAVGALVFLRRRS